MTTTKPLKRVWMSENIAAAGVSCWWRWSIDCGSLVWLNHVFTVSSATASFVCVCVNVCLALSPWILFRLLEWINLRPIDSQTTVTHWRRSHTDSPLLKSVHTRTHHTGYVCAFHCPVNTREVVASDRGRLPSLCTSIVLVYRHNTENNDVGIKSCLLSTAKVIINN